MDIHREVIRCTIPQTQLTDTRLFHVSNHWQSDQPLPSSRPTWSVQTAATPGCGNSGSNQAALACLIQVPEVISARRQAHYLRPWPSSNTAARDQLSGLPFPVPARTNSLVSPSQSPSGHPARSPNRLNSSNDTAQGRGSVFMKSSH